MLAVCTRGVISKGELESFEAMMDKAKGRTGVRVWLLQTYMCREHEWTEGLSCCCCVQIALVRLCAYSRIHVTLSPPPPVTYLLSLCIQ